jgi:hypothetical protein
MSAPAPASASGYPRAPRMLRAGLVGIDPVARAVGSVVVLQYNPDSISRTLQPRTTAAEPGDRLEALRLTGPPHETIKFEAEIDATDQLERPDLAANEPATTGGLLPTLAALEALVTPTARQLQALDSLYDQGQFEVIPTEAPLTVLVLGARRVVPVRITSLSITEEAFDAALHPIRAKANVECKVLSTNDLPFAHLGTGLYIAYRQAAERLGGMVGTTSVQRLGLAHLP